MVRIPGVTAAAVVSRDGFVVEAAIIGDIEPEALGAAVASGAGAMELMTRVLNMRDFRQAMAECASGVVLMGVVNADSILAVLAEPDASLGMLRHHCRRVLPLLNRVLDGLPFPSGRQDTDTDERN